LASVRGAAARHPKPENLPGTENSRESVEHL
jgi:hypothetical protein